MIAVSDAVLILVSATALVAGLLRWQDNVEATTRPQTSIQSSASQPSPSTSTQNQNTSTLSSPATIADEVQSATIILQDSVEAVTPAVTTTGIEQSIQTVPVGNYTVQAGDSLSKIALDFGTSVELLQRINAIEGSLIEVGQEIKYPLPVN